MSGTNKAMDLHLQMRQNTEDLVSFMKDLESWETDIKKKDEELRKGRVQEGQMKLPPVRNKDYKSKMKAKKKKSEPAANGQAKGDENKKDPRIKSYDYSSWEKFDVDKALSEVDKEDSPADSNDSDSEEAAPDREKALAEKEKGNAFFRDGRYNEAIECYTRGMGADPHNPVLPTNRATAFFRLKKYAVAESDCNLAVVLDGSYVKAYARRGAARLALKKYEPALEDYETVLKLSPGNMEALCEVKKIKEILGCQGPAGVSGAAQPPEAPALDPDQQSRVEAQQRQQEAVFHKDRGNAYFKEGKYEAAVECYSQGMEADSMNILLPANRAMAFLKLQRYEEAEEDCSRAICLDDSYSKAFARRGTARAALGRLQEAKQDFEEVLKLEPGNKQALNELQKVQIALNSSNVQPPDGTQRRTVQPIDKPAHLRSAKPLRRMEIVEVSGSTEHLPAGPRSVIQDETREAEERSSPLSMSPTAKMIKMGELAEVSSRSPDPVLSGTRSEGPAQEAGVDPAPSPTDAELPPPPSNSFQLEAQLHTIGNQPEVVYRYLRQIKPEEYGNIFRNSLEPDVLHNILRTLRDFYLRSEGPAVTLEVLRSLAAVGRFDMAVMFMSSAERKVVSDLFDFLRQAELEASVVTALQKKYGL
ncbi:RNA polymerase II-associated protein 3 [Takifugu flavidus]|uniref:RNA polymerase II-associated protein 3 n=1 Tax=Takifugu flavidus TaxID=433684 RepID=A0A5C6NAG5_9TELE|nr:RNA polymerase II-associated protein 3 [Takifugu flavidus]XP_056878627.1 RNA polymerase II-associated protein 3 [Takifugu flavidus]TWW64474.1 RNA polymerase II-associated protein 3 [Takifugu flavidus]